DAADLTARYPAEAARIRGLCRP
ncbi:cupin domain-containing protein, partial [Streptomyces sp. SID6139]|nr:cupin domain-containing protein [Streptomyces sp. SID6139]